MREQATRREPLPGGPRQAPGADRAVRRAARPLSLSPRLHWRLLHVALDAATVFVAAMATYALYLASDLGSGHFDPAFYTQVNLGVTAITLFALIGHGVYTDQLGLLRVEAVRRLLRGVFAALVLTLALTFFLKAPGFSRLTVLGTGPVVVLALVVQRQFVWAYQARRVARGRGTTPVLVYGAGETGRLLAQRLLDEHPLGVRPVALLDDDVERHDQDVRVGAGIEGARLPVLGGEAELPEVVARTGAAAVFVAMPEAPLERVARLVALLDELGIEFFTVPSGGGELLGTLAFERIAGFPLYRRRRADENPLYRVANRTLDVVGSAVLLTVSAPVLAAAAALVRVTSGGSAFFRQRRVGLDGQPFTIWKLRTMHHSAPAYAAHPTRASDPRVTRVGRWLRRLSIDELPQLWNVLKGDMSLVGPRPEMPYVVDRYGDLERQRLSVKPGVTGLWQISADRAFDIHDNIHYDLTYVEHRSLSLDLAILLLTPFALLARNRAH